MTQDIEAARWEEAYKIVDRHSGYMNGLDHGQAYINVSDAICAVAEALSRPCPVCAARGGE